MISEKWKTILHSSRFRAISANVLFIVINEILGRKVSMEVVGMISALIITFAIGRTFKEDEGEETESILKKLKDIDAKHDSQEEPDGAGG
jgi:hypothetical protein